MKLSELISELQKALAESGDADVEYQDSEFGHIQIYSLKRYQKRIEHVKPINASWQIMNDIPDQVTVEDVDYWVLNMSEE